MGEKSKRTGINIIFGWINNIVKIGCPFLSRTMVIYFLGIQYVGLSSLFSAVLGLLSLTELGFDAAIMYLMYDAVAKNDTKKISSYQNYLKRVYRTIGCVMLLFGCIAMPFLKYLINTKTALPDDVNVIILYILFLLNTVVSYFFGGYKQGLLKVYQRNDVISKVDTLCVFFLSVIQIIILLAARSYYLYTVARVLVTILENILLKSKADVLYPEIKDIGAITREEKQKIGRLVYGNFMAKVGGVLSTSFDSAICSAFLGLSILGYYSNYIYISNSVISFLVIIYSSMQGAIGNDVVIKSKESNLENLYMFSFMYIWLASWCAFTLFFLTPQFIVLWIQEEGLLPQYVLIAIVINFYVVIFNSVMGIYKDADGIFWDDRYRGIISGLVNLCLNLFLAFALRKYGDGYVLIGIVLSTVISIIFISVPWAIGVTFKKYFCKSPKPFVLFLLKMSMVFALILIAGIFLSDCIGISDGAEGVYKLLFRGLICIVFPNLVMFLCYRKTEQFMKSRIFIKQHLAVVKGR